MKKIIFLLLTAYCLLFTGCKPKEIIVYHDKIHDSIVKETVKDTFIKWMPQKQSVIAVKRSHLETDFSFSDAAIDSTGYLRHSIENKGIIPAKIKQTTIKIRELKTVNKTYYQTKTVIKEVPTYGFLHYSGLFGWIALIIFTLYKLKQKLTL